MSVELILIRYEPCEVCKVFVADCYVMGRHVCPDCGIQIIITVMRDDNERKDIGQSN